MIRRSWFVMLGMACALAMPRAGHAAKPKVTVSIEKTGPRACRVAGSFTVDAPGSAVWGVLTDYDGIARFVSSLRSSKVLERGEGRLRLEQEATARAFLVSKKVRLLLEVRERPMREIVFEEVSHKDFAIYRGSWLIEGSIGGTRVVYSLEAQRSFAAPSFIADHAFEVDARSLLDQVRLEILRRAKEARP